MTFSHDLLTLVSFSFQSALAEIATFSRNSYYGLLVHSC